MKPANLGSSVGISKAGNREELAAGLDLAARYDGRLLVEPGIDAREIEIAILGNSDPQASVPAKSALIGTSTTTRRSTLMLPPS